MKDVTANTATAKGLTAMSALSSRLEQAANKLAQTDPENLDFDQLIAYTQALAAAQTSEVLRHLAQIQADHTMSVLNSLNAVRAEIEDQGTGTKEAYRKAHDEQASAIVSAIYGSK
ncbi:hypothetical protein D2E52_22190 [Mycobacteroides abscessus]|uniref:Uncharacterized protein n=1 Tax=Mycobacteroides abscessus TaxID=36809 RepID=A0ABD7HGQ8_9MYCO|nr:hypothetical protein DDJ61_23430 [Mycobacteroides abscessus]PVA72200.1 hypothetical protein DDJ76_23720 [Mycobacteroides abscessus]PVB12856.1 hypothetical protein DDJ68_21460 [Mycobacteroides abscessus]RIR83464.1 hypothetical protein D2E57_25890 [Mycobacteroides abscessus]RIR84382.1 hypothetical protein D2E50_21510 [Mycobacteroides abscessus]